MFLEQRLGTVLNQTFQDFELIILDDNSSDGSWNYLKQYQDHPKVSYCIRNEVNSGSPFKQWKKGIELAKGELIWIAESDDWSELTFLDHCVSYFESKDIGLVMAASKYVDCNNQVLRSISHVCPCGFYEGIHFLKNHMYFKNSVINASAVVFRKSFIKERILNQVVNFRLSGDHLFWTALMSFSKLVIIEDQLNFFRWHDQSVRKQELKNLTGLKEGIKIKNWIESQIHIDKRDRIRSRREVYLNFFKFLKNNPSSKNFNEFLEISSFFSFSDKLKAWVRFALF